MPTIFAIISPEIYQKKKNSMLTHLPFGVLFITAYVANALLSTSKLSDVTLNPGQFRSSRSHWRRCILFGSGEILISDMLVVRPTLGQPCFGDYIFRPFQTICNNSANGRNNNGSTSTKAIFVTVCLKFIFVYFWGSPDI